MLIRLGSEFTGYIQYPDGVHPVVSWFARFVKKEPCNIKVAVFIGPYDTPGQAVEKIAELVSEGIDAELVTSEQVQQEYDHHQGNPYARVEWQLLQEKIQ